MQIHVVCKIDNEFSFKPTVLALGCFTYSIGCLINSFRSNKMIFSIKIVFSVIVSITLGAPVDQLSSDVIVIPSTVTPPELVRILQL